MIFHEELVRVLSKKDPTPTDYRRLVDSLQLLESDARDGSGLADAIMNSGFVFERARAYGGQRNVVFDKDGITLRPAENSLFNWTVISWEPADDAGRWYGVLGCYLTGTTPNRSGMVGLTAQNESGGSGIAQLDLQAAGGVTAWIKIHTTSGYDINASGVDLDTQIQGENVADVLGVDAGLDIASIGTTLRIKERAAALPDTATYGQLYVKNADPNELWYVDGEGTETQLA